jgi:5-epi-alpha-selinene synthase
MRRYTGAMDTVFDCIELVEHLHLSKAVREHSTVSRLRLMANNCVCWANDLFSVDKELLEHNTHNLVFVLRSEYGLTLSEAVEQAVTMHDAEVRAFEWFAARMPSFGEEMDAAVRIYVAGLRSWMRGNIAWARETPRYKGCLSMRGCSPDV